MIRSHWTPAYLNHRVRNAVYRLRHPKAPWLTPEAVAFLDKWLGRGHEGIEWGTGRSTCWFACRVGRLTSVEHDPAWFVRTCRRLEKVSAGRVRVLLREASAENYAGIADEFENGALDFVLVDGVSAWRDVCTLAAIPKIREGGLLILDDAQRYLPLDVGVPDAVGSRAEPITPAWKQAVELLASWKRQVSCDGLRATVIWRRPVAASMLKTGGPGA